MAQKKSDRNPSKNIQKTQHTDTTNMKLQIGSQYLCQSSFNAPNLPHVLKNLTAPPHLHLVIDASLQHLSETEQAYEVRLNLQAYGFDHIPSEGEELAPLYHAHVIYGGLFGVSGTGGKEDIEQFVLNEAPHYLYPFARTILLTAIKDAGFNVGHMQPVDFKELWNQNRKSTQKSL